MTGFLTARLPYVVEHEIRLFSGICGHEAAFTEERTATLDLHGWLFVPRGFASDGASGPTWDTPCVQRAAACHDALYGMIFTGALPMSCRKPADRLLYSVMLLDGCPAFRAQLWFCFLRVFGRLALLRRIRK